MKGLNLYQNYNILINLNINYSLANRFLNALKIKL